MNIQDTSIFQDIVQFTAPATGVEYRCTWEGLTWGVYELRDDSFVRVDRVTADRNATPGELYGQILSDDNEQMSDDGGDY